MNTQNRMNAGAEYVLSRIWAALQGEQGIHVESLLTCLGALAGYACQVSVRQTAALPGADPMKYALRAVEASNGTTYLHGDALNVPLSESPLSVWALAGRAVQKLGKPLPDIDDIHRHVTQSVGTSAFGVPRVADGHRPRYPAIVYLKQLWPQVLPIAQRFCNKPMQIPILFGIVLQRAIEHTSDALNPTLSASIAMECAVAMSKVALPGDYANAANTRSEAVAPEMFAAAVPMTAPARGKGAESTLSRSKPASSKRKRAAAVEASMPDVRALLARLPPAVRVVTISFVAFFTIVAAMYESDPVETPAIAQVEREPERLSVQNDDTFTPELPTQEAQVVSQEQQRPVIAEAPPPETPPTPSDPTEGVMSDDTPAELVPGLDSSTEMAMRDDL